MANALGVLQALIKQKRKEQEEQAFTARVINTNCSTKFNGVQTHHDYDRLSGVDKTMFLEYLGNSRNIADKPRLIYNKKPLYGVGINDAPYQVITNLRGTRVTCPAYRAWKNMLDRCYSDAVHKQRPTYIGCEVTPEWHYFTVFRSWWLLHHKDGYQLDKDILLPTNNIYSPEFCIFIPAWLNSFCSVCNTNRGALPLGVSIAKGQRSRPLQAMCSNGYGKQIRIGLYSTPEEARLAWLNYKLSIVDARSAELEAIRAGLTDKVKAKVLSLV